MPRPLSLLLLVLFLHVRYSKMQVEDKDDFQKKCRPSTCGKGGLKIRFPYRLESSPPLCGVPGMELSCSGEDTILALPHEGSLTVTTIDYLRGETTIKLGGSWAQCSVANFTSINLTTTIYRPYSWNVTLVECPGELAPNISYDFNIGSPISCLSSETQFVYIVGGNEDMDKVPSQCRAIANVLNMPLPRTTGDFEDTVDDFVANREVTLSWSVPPVTDECKACEKEREVVLKVEKFLATYKTIKPMRYTFSELKKITKRFRSKLGQGGFGSVYKGELANGIPVAVKMLERSKGDGQEFINEVATIGRIHHVNVIAIGIARGIEYLHQGCNQRILHFDIKPHNILLDHKFNPKISDFGLAKLCSRDQSIVSMTAARGTLGYIAPEVYSRNFGTVSYKSDVYSFGMLVLEIVGGRRIIDPEIENQSEFYFPEWIYDQLVNGQDIGSAMQIAASEAEIASKLAIVALWCIQWNSTNRPSMTRVVQMLTGDSQKLRMPPKPFVPSDSSSS
uniref:Protein kinase domain-containing protein n=1 Tax=Ananas comosus var. bracteatus TaxID=296719 RepID=A0A6V7Q5H5_ANACO|nr:unnamed protein product [Ananas comosus var. bracteatus]